MTLESFLRDFASWFTTSTAAGLAAAVVAGILASAVCPCTLPVGVGVASVSGATQERSGAAGLVVASAFFAGIVANLTLLGAIAGRLGDLGTEAFGRSWSLAMAILSLAAAVLAFAGPRLSTTRLARLRRPGVAGAFGYGFVFSLGTSVAPLFLLLTVAAGQADPGFGVALAFAFGVGRGLPFLLVSAFATLVMRFVRLAVARPILQVVSGAALLFVSAYYLRAFLSLL